MFEYLPITARKNQLQFHFDEMSGRGWRLHTANLSMTGMWELIFERPAMLEKSETGRILSAYPNEAQTPQPEKKKPGRKPKVKQEV